MVEKPQMSGFWPTLADPFRLAGSRLADWLSPVAEASSGADGYKITMELPGVNEEDIHLSVDQGMVTIKGEKKTEREEKGETWFFSERQFGSFSRSFRLPADADEGAVKAALKDGVLTVTVPKKAAAEPGTKRVPIAKG
jgi:HSP20 family protein